MSTLIASQLKPGTRVVDGDRTVEITRVHRGAPKGKVLVSYRSPTGHGMVALPDTERLQLAPEIRRGRLRVQVPDQT